MSELTLCNRQRDQRVNMRLFRRLTHAALEEIFPDQERMIGIHLVGLRVMTKTNQDYLAHEGPTDVITFDHGSGPTLVYGEIYICVAVATTQAEEFGTTWADELVRYMVHGLLHLNGFDDKTTASRRKMKREENRIVRKLGSFYPLSELDSRSKLNA